MDTGRANVPSIPPIGFAGIMPLADVIEHLPLPTPLPERFGVNQSLIFHPRIAAEAEPLLENSDPVLANHLIALLSSSSNFDHVILKDECQTLETLDTKDDEDAPDLLKAILAQEPSIFGDKTNAAVLYSAAINGSGEQVQSIAQQTVEVAAASTVSVPKESPSDGKIPESYRHLFPHRAVVRLEPLPPSTHSVAKQAKQSSLNTVATHATKISDDATRKKIISIGKQPKVQSQNRKKKDMVSELFDSLTPSAEYFGDRTRRRRTTSRLCAEDVYAKVSNDFVEEDDVVEKDASPASPESKDAADYEGRVSPPTQAAKEDEEWREIMKRRKEKNRRRSMRASFIDPKEIAENESYQRFMSAMDTVFDNVEECDLTVDEDEIPSECLISKSVISELASESNKLRAAGLLNKVPVERLTKLITILERNIKDGSNLSIGIDEKLDDGTLLNIIADRVFRSLDAACVALTIMTGHAMPRQVFIEDAIERAAQLLKFQLINTVAPTFDPTYRISMDVESDANSKSKRFKSHSHGSLNKSKIITSLYGRLIDLVGSFADLISVQTLPETIIVLLCSFGVGSFFIENLREFQLSALRLLSNIFNCYENCRKMILEEILTSLARTPNSRKSSRNYKLSVDESIQMISALIVQLVQSAVHVPSAISRTEEDEEESKLRKGSAMLDIGSVVLSSYDKTIGTAHTFLHAFLNKCRTKSDEDYRPLFEAFVEDLLLVLHKPEWPASELMLNLLGKLLVQNFSNKQTDISLRVASLEYLGMIAARLRKDAMIYSLDDDADSDEILHSLSTNENSAPSVSEASIQEKTRLFQTALVDYILEIKESDPILEFARQYYVAQWYKDLIGEQERIQKTKKGKESNTNALADARCFVLSLVDRNIEEFYGSKLQQRAPSLKPDQVAFVVRWLAKKRSLSQCFEIYLTQILRVLNETVVAIRSKAMKCLSVVVEADPTILARPDVHRGVHSRLIDTSSSVREVAIDLIGKFVTAKPELVDQYYQMIIDRILDTGVSVRKRVIKILREICEKRPDFEKNAEICVRLLRRMNDEEGVRKLVCETFHSMWFTSVREKDTPRLLKKVLNIADAVGACAKDGGQYDGFESLMNALLCKDPEKTTLTAAKQIVNCLVENVLTLDEKLVDSGNDRSSNHQRMLYCLTTLYLFAKVKPSLMVEHAQTMQPYLSMSCSTQGEQAVLIQVIKILEMVVPLMDHPSESFLSQVEETLLRLAARSGQNVIQASISCLGAIVNKLTKNWQQVSLLFQKYLALLSQSKGNMEICSGSIRPELKPQIFRSLFTIGLLCQHFDFDSFARKSSNDQTFWNDQAFSLLIYFVNARDEDVRLKAFASLGYFCTNHPAYLLSEETKRIYLTLLSDLNADIKLKVQVLRNIENFLLEEENKLTKSYKEWDREKQKEDLKEMGDVASGQGSSVIQHYLKEVLESYFHPLASVRFGVCNVVMLTLQQGLVHPVQCITHVIAMCTDNELSIRNKAENMLKEIDSKYSGFVQMKAYEGVKMSFKLQQMLAEGGSSDKNVAGRQLARGLRSSAQEQPQALNALVYSLLRSVRQQRRGFFKSLLQSFDEISNVCLEELIYIADNLATFPYQTLDEPLFVMHSIDLTVSVTGASLLHAFEEALISPSNKHAVAGASDLDEIETEDAIYSRLPQNILPLEECIKASRGCVLLLVLKQYLKDVYGINDSKIQEYSPSEPAKTYEKAISKRSTNVFDPKYVADFLESLKQVTSQQDANRILCRRFVEFKELMMSIDTVSASEEPETSNQISNS